jgi:hypothetical protein
MRPARRTSMAVDARLSALMERRAIVCRLTPERALQTLDEAEAFLRERGMLTLSPDCSLPSLFGACHEEPYRAGSHGFGTWPKTKWRWSFELRERPGVHILKIHRGKGLYLTEQIAGLADPLCRAALVAAEAGELGSEARRLVRHLAAVGPAMLDDLKEQLILSAASLRSARTRLERVGAVVSRDVVLGEDGDRQSSELARWDQLSPAPPHDDDSQGSQGSGGNVIEELVVAGVRAAVVAPEAEVGRWFSWDVPQETIAQLVEAGYLVRPAPGWLACESDSPG